MVCDQSERAKRSKKSWFLGLRPRGRFESDTFARWRRAFLVMRWLDCRHHGMQYLKRFAVNFLNAKSISASNAAPGPAQKIENPALQDRPHCRYLGANRGGPCAGPEKIYKERGRLLNNSYLP